MAVSLLSTVCAVPSTSPSSLRSILSKPPRTSFVTGDKNHPWETQQRGDTLKSTQAPGPQSVP